MDKINKAETHRIFCLHNLEHLLDVARIAYILTLERDVPLDKEIIYASALLHDIGRWQQYLDESDHALVSAELAIDILKACDFNQQEIQLIIQAIKKHREGNDLSTDLDFILYEADKQSRLCINCKSSHQCMKKEDIKNQSIEY